jgi:hypothetical protein
MTRRKPHNLSVTSWVDQQIRDAERRGSFDDLPGKGKPIPGLHEPHTDASWIAAKLRRENIDIAALLPPSLALAKELEDLPERLARCRTEREVRAIADDLNERIRQAHRRPQEGPPLLVMTRDVERVVDEWRAAHP